LGMVMLGMTKSQMVAVGVGKDSLLFSKSP